MIGEWIRSNAIIIIVDLIGLYIVIRFLSWKVQHKLEEVEQRQIYANRQKKINRQNSTLDREQEWKHNNHERKGYAWRNCVYRPLRPVE